MKIGQHIYQLRTTQNLTQEELASKVYVTRQTVSNWERGYSYPDLQSLMTISEYFNISVHELLKEDLPKIERSLSMKAHQHFQQLSTEFTLLLIWFVISSIFSVYFFRENGLLLNLIISSPWLVYKAFQVERYKNDYQLRTYQDISDFLAGEITQPIKAPSHSKTLFWNVLNFLLTMILSFLAVYLLLHLIL